MYNTHPQAEELIIFPSVHKTFSKLTKLNIKQDSGNSKGCNNSKYDLWLDRNEAEDWSQKDNQKTHSVYKLSNTFQKTNKLKKKPQLKSEEYFELNDYGNTT